MMATRILSDAGGQDERDTSDVLSDIWLYRNWFGDAAGPVSQFDITMLMEVGDLQPNSLVSCDGGKSWMPLSVAAEDKFVDMDEMVTAHGQPTREPSTQTSPFVSPVGSRVRAKVPAPWRQPDGESAFWGGPSTLSSSANTSADMMLLGQPPVGFSFNIDGSTPETIAAEVTAFHEALRSFFTARGEQPRFPGLRGEEGHARYGSPVSAGSLARQMVEQCASAINACKHLCGRPAESRRSEEAVFWTFLMTVGFWVGREDPAAFEAFEPEVYARSYALIWDPATSSSEQSPVIDGVAQLIILHLSRAETLSFEGERQEERRAELEAQLGGTIRANITNLYRDLEMPVFSVVLSLLLLERALRHRLDNYTAQNRLRFFLPATVLALKLTCATDAQRATGHTHEHPCAHARAWRSRHGSTCHRSR